MQVELRNHPAQKCRERRLPGDVQTIEPMFDEHGAPVPLFPDQHGIYLLSTDGNTVLLVGYCQKQCGTPVSLTEQFNPVVAEWIIAEVNRQRDEAAQRCE